ncbi:glucose PTS transporter subunit IIA [Spiroplasma alleghenense]|uniref:PTS system, beta-glucoside-specific IIABC component n=1 Tax=Spiroplasma alleghenense TaxID=216931 RepID=A0A345Z4W4_9MOLU|nr:glucose PTS transporter subunit IIA [Spiroplasma alleghenense]AXK51643.1 PTS system, beta-glucoside-specific IIABC component [Spiroplasma alleghenense]
MKKEVYLYAPCDGVIKDITFIQDEAFASKALGEGIFIEPSSNIFHAPIGQAKIALIADTKHAYYFEQEDGLQLLMHIGLETVGLNGAPYKLLAQVNDNVTWKSPIVEVDFDLIKNNKCSLATPIVMDVNSTKNWVFKALKLNGKVKQGDKIGVWTYEEKINQQEIIEIVRSKGKYQKVAEQILAAIGGKGNQNSVYNCMTRLRIKIIDQKLVNCDELKKIEVVKGLNQNGDELQVIIGGEVYKIKDEVINILENKTTSNDKVVKTKTPFRKKIMPAVAGIVTPAIPVLLGTGILGGIQAMLVAFGVLQAPGLGETVADLNLWSAIFYVAGKVGLELIGLIFIYNTVKYLGGNPIMGIFVGMVLTSRHLFGTSWVLFNLFGNPVGIQSYEGTVLPMVAAGFVVYYLDKWVQKWMPTAVDIVFRPGLVMLVTVIVTLFTVGPVLKIVEQLLSQFVLILGKLPIGIGVGIFALLWQPLVLTGTHVAVVQAVSLPMTQIPAQPSAMYVAVNIAVFAQIGAVLAVALRTSNQKTKQTAYGSIPGAIFGITEPAIFGVNLPKLWPFLYGCLGAFIGGMFAGIVGAEQITRTGTGILSYLGFGTPLNTAMGLSAAGIALGSALLLTICFYKERPSEITGLKKMNTIVLKNIITENQNVELKNNFETILKLEKANLTDNKVYEILVIKLAKLEQKKQLLVEWTRHCNIWETPYNTFRRFIFLWQLKDKNLTAILMN